MSTADEKKPQAVKEETELPRKCNIGLDALLVSLNLCMRVYCAFNMIISDCDETYNYWEPLNLVMRGFGKQTWEYSPEYSIRSFFYLIPYYLITSPLRDFVSLTGYEIPSYAYFYYIRLVGLCGFTSLAEIKLFYSLKRNVLPQVSYWFLFFSTISTGMAHASVALLPSSFAMTWLMISTSYLLDSVQSSVQCLIIKSTALGVFSLSIGGIVGWPFALILGAPFAIFTLTRRLPLATILRLAFICSLFLALLCAAITVVDSFYYKTLKLFVPLNIVLYNVFAGEDEGPEIFGIEPFSYYLKNLLLNFNFLALASLGGVLCSLYRRSTNEVVCITFPLLLWCSIFGTQPHKEERFLYPIYPLITASAAVFVTKARDSICCKKILRLLILCFGIGITTLSVLRTLHLVENYSAPLRASHVFNQLPKEEMGQGMKNVCVGDEWYHFPTSFFLPDNFRLKFVKSNFDGLLPGDFLENTSLQNATSIIPPGMNSKNLFAEDKVVDFGVCDYFVEKITEDLESRSETVLGNENYCSLKCEKMIDTAQSSPILSRLLYLPPACRNILRLQPAKMNFCVFEKTSKAVD